MTEAEEVKCSQLTTEALTESAVADENGWLFVVAVCLVMQEGSMEESSKIEYLRLGCCSQALGATTQTKLA